VVLFLLFLIWRWISPSSADRLLYWLQDLPVNTTNYVNKDILNKDIVLPLHNPVETVKEGIQEWVEDLKEGVSFESLDADWNVEMAVEEEEGPRYSWLSKLFKRDKTSEDKQVTVEVNESENNEIEDETTWEVKQFVEKRHEWVDVRLSENGEIVIETITSSGEKIIDTVAKVWNWSWDQSKNEDKKEVKNEETTKVTTWTSQKNEKPVKVESKTKTWEKVVESTKKEENEVVYLKSNPKNTETTTSKTTKSNTATKSDSTIAPVKAVRWLTAEEVREANAIFN